MSMRQGLINAVEICTNLEAIRGVITWPVFSWSSFCLVSRLRGKISPPATVLDVGANVGQFCIAVAHAFPEAKIICFEPLPGAAGVLRDNVRKLGNVEVRETALGLRNGMASLYVNSHWHSSSTLRLGAKHQAAFPFAQEVGSISVRTETLDAAISAVGLRSPVLLKMDVQGAERDVLRGGEQVLGSVDYIVLETSFVELYEGETVFRDMLDVLEGYGFTLESPLGWLRDPRTDLVLQMDALFRRRVARGPERADG